MEDWVRWHEAYDDPASSLARRLVVVRERIGQALDALALGAPAAPGPRAGELRILSLCAGDGRDLLPVLALRPVVARPADGRPGAVLVENDPDLAAAARRRARAHGLANVGVVVGDAGAPRGFAEAFPADLLLLCGIFGNIARQDIAATVGAVPTLVAPGGYVIWTRGASAPDLRPAIRDLFIDAGLDEVAFDGHPETYGVGVARVPDVGLPPGDLPDRLFTFLR